MHRPVPNRRRLRRRPGLRLLRGSLAALVLLSCSILLIWPVSLVEAANESAPLLVAGLLRDGAGQPGPDAPSAAAPATRFGLNDDDLADVMAAYWLQEWGIVQGVPPDAQPPTRAVRAVEDAVRRALQTNAAAGHLSDAQRRALIRRLDALAAADQAAAPSLDRQKAIGARFMADGIDLSRLHLTDAGFLRK